MEDTLETHYAHLNKPRHPKKNISVADLHIPSKVLKNKLSAPSLLVHEVPKFVYKLIAPFTPEIQRPVPSIFLPEIFKREDYDIILNTDDPQVIYDLMDRKFAVEFPDKKTRLLFTTLLNGVLTSCRQNQFSRKSMDTLLSIYHQTHLYVVANPWRSSEATYSYFRELILLHSVLHPPKSTKIFSATESKCALLVFCKIYLRNLPIIRTLALPNYRINVEWMTMTDAVKTKK